MCGISRTLERFQAKWIPVRVKKTRQGKNPEPGSDAIRTEKALAAQQQPCKTSSDVRSLRLPDHGTLACEISRPPSALLAADAKRRQGLDHAGRDRIAVRGSSGRFQQGRSEDAGIPVAESERQDSRHPGSGRARRQAAAAVRDRRDPAIPCGQDRQAPAGRPGAAIPDHPVAALPDGRDRTDVRPGRLLPQIRRQGVCRQAAARALRRRVRSGCWVWWRRGLPDGNGSWTTNTPSPTFPCSAGCAT